MDNSGIGEIYLKYKKALVAIGVDLANEDIREYIIHCHQDLEARFQAIVSYWYWLQTQEREIIEPNQLLIKAFYQQWKPIDWKDEYLLNENFKTPAEKWWSKASQVNLIKNLIIDVKDNFWSGGKIIFNHPYGEPWTMDLDTAMDMSWQQIIAHYQRVTKTVIESHERTFGISQRRVGENMSDYKLIKDELGQIIAVKSPPKTKE